MAETGSSDSFEVLEGSMEHLNLQTPFLASSHSDQIDLLDDVWGEDETLHDSTSDGMGWSSDLNWEWKRRHDQFHSIGYRDGITAGKEASAQEGFNVGFKQSVGHGYKWGLVRGVSGAYANLPNHLKEKLEGRIENRGRFQNLYQCSQMISTTNALKMFHETIQHTETKKEPAEESNSHLLINSAERSRLNQLDGHFKELISLLDDSGVVKVKIDPGLETSGWTS